MVPDCVDLTAKAKAYAVAHHINICGLGVAATTVGPRPMNEVYGDCGASGIYLTYGGGDVAYFSYGFNSTVGDADYRDLVIHWTGANTGSFTDASVMFDYVYNGFYSAHFNPGTTTAILGGTIEIWWGLTCYMAGPTSTITM